MLKKAVFEAKMSLPSKTDVFGVPKTLRFFSTFHIPQTKGLQEKGSLHAVIISVPKPDAIMTLSLFFLI